MKMHLVKFILDYFISQDIYFINAITCWDSTEKVQFYRDAAEYGARLVLSPAINLPTLQGYRREGVLLDLQCPRAGDILMQASDTKAFNRRYGWLLIDVKKNFIKNELKTLQNKINLLTDANFVYSTIDGSFEIYRVKIDKPLLISNMGLNSSTTRQEMAALHLSRLSERRKSLNITLTAGTVISAPSVFKGWDDNNLQVDVYAKFVYPLLMYLAEDLNISYNLRQVDTYGVLKASTNGSHYTGICGLFEKGLIEVGVVSLMMRTDRFSIVDYVAETVPARSKFILKQPAQSVVSNMFLLPFSQGVWLATALTFLLGGVFLAAGSGSLRSQYPELREVTALEIFTFLVGVICQQGTNINPNSESVRLVMLVTLMTSVFAFTAYSAKIVAILQTPSNAIKTIDDLTSSPIACGAENVDYKTVYYQESNDPAVQKFYKHKLQPQGENAFMSAADGIARMRREFFAFQVEAESGYQLISQTFTEEEKCGLTQFDAFQLPRVGIPIIKGSGYRNLIAVRLRWHREVGLFERTRRIWLPRMPRCEVAGTGFVSPGLTDLQPAILMLLYGVILALVALAVEVFTFKINLKKKLAYVYVP